MRSTLAAAAFLGISICSLGFGQRVGDKWVTTRGDATPNLTYSAATTTTSGRIIAVGGNGALMFSDNGGTDWKFGQIKIDGLPVFGGFNTIFQVPGGSLIAVMARLEESTEGYFDYYVRTYFLTSSDNGNSWSMAPFPLSHATYELTGDQFPGVNITGLKLGPGGELIAYGTTTGTNHPGAIYWNIGGAIFRRAGATWTQAHFGYGPVDKIASAAGGRAIAVAHNAVLDSADGSAWAGYPMSLAQVDVGGEPMDPETKGRLRVIDVDTIGDDYVAQGGTFVPLGESGIDTNIFDEIFTLTSSAPFSGGRAWQAYPQSGYNGTYRKADGAILAAGPRGVYRATSAGGGFELVGSEVRAWAETIAVSGSTATAVQSSETVWQSANGGSSWTKVWDKPVGPNLEILGFFDGTLFARAQSGNQLWTSEDNGLSWQLRATDFRGLGSMLQIDGGRLIAPAGSGRVQVSDDGGYTWVFKTIPGTTESAFLIEQSETGRIVIPVEGHDVMNNGPFYVSDDGGETWTAKKAGLVWNKGARAIGYTSSGRIIVSTNSLAGFDHAFHISDDDGETWRISEQLQTLDGLDPITNQPDRRVIEISRIRTGKSGRIVALGEDEILTSDDDGETWAARVNLDHNNPGAFLGYKLVDLIEAGERWVAIGHYTTPHPHSTNKHFLLISDNDGASWGMRPFETNQTSTFLWRLGVGAGGRLVISGANGAVFVSDPQPASSLAPALSVREGAKQTLPVERPGLAGSIEASYSLVERTAIAGEDYVASGGALSWAADDFEPKEIAIETIDNGALDSERHFLLQLRFETEDALLGANEMAVTIVDDETSKAGLVFLGAQSLYTTEAGGSATLRFALERKPSSDVTLSISGLDQTEGSLSATSFAFTPGNWATPQSVTVAGVDDSTPDGDVAYELVFAISSSDTDYSILPPARVAVVNMGDEPYEIGGESMIDILAAYAGHPLALAPGGVATFTLPDSLDGIEIGSEISEDLKVWTPGPAPVAGASEGGFTTYTIQLPEADPAVFARVTFTTE